jgi:hypothetical protein
MMTVTSRIHGLMLCALLGVTASARATVLTFNIYTDSGKTTLFDTNPDASAISAYGNNVNDFEPTAAFSGKYYSYGTNGGLTPHVAIQYRAVPGGGTSGNIYPVAGDLDHVLYTRPLAYALGSGTNMEVRLTPRTGRSVRIESFDAAAYGIGETIPNQTIKVVADVGLPSESVLWSAGPDETVTVTGHHAHYTPQVSVGPAHTLSLVYGNSADFAVDNIQFSEFVNGVVSYADTVRSDQPFGYWRLGETSGTTAFDQTVNHLDGAYSNSVALGQRGALKHDPDTAVDFIGGGVTVADATPFHTTTALSIEMWITADNTLADWAALLMKTTSGSWNDGYGLYWRNTGTLNFWVANYANTVGMPFSTGSVYHQIVATYLGSQAGNGNVFSIYVDGVLTNQVNSTVSAFGDNTAKLMIGLGYAGQAVWDGKIDEVSIYAYTLNAEQVAAHYAAGRLVPNWGTTISFH